MMRAPRNQPEDELIRRLHRLVAEVKANRHRDRRILLSMQSDIRTLRNALHEKCNALSEQMKASGRRVSAISAYARTASITRGLTPARTNTSNGVKS
jgi:hypothetical protein